jgi:hypothetical protein
LFTPAVTAYVRPYAYYHDRYGAYYREGLRRHLARIGGVYEEVSMGRVPRVLRSVRYVRDAYRLQSLFERAPWLARGIDDAAAFVEGQVRSPSGSLVETTSHYRLRAADGREIRVTVDAHDAGSRPDGHVLAWSDVCFKTNHWPTVAYPRSVVPLVNADPLVLEQVDAFRAYRSAPKRYDVCMVVRIWGGADELEGIEHNLRLIEAASRARCSKFLYAYLVAGDVEGARRRLERQGIPCGTAPVPQATLWRISSESRLCVIRLGMHHCIPWRVTGALAIGAAIVLDRVPFTRWPEPLCEDRNFVSLGAHTGVGRPVAADAEYASIPDKLDAWAADHELSACLARNNGVYFDEHLDPERVGAHILATALRRAGLDAGLRRAGDGPSSQAPRTPETTRSRPP